MRKVWLALAILVLSPVSWADEPKVRGPIEAAEDAIQEKKSEEQLRIEENKRKIEAERAQRAARVVVLEWENSNANYKNETLKRNIRVRLDRNEAQFFPAIDLYQQGRAENRSDRKRTMRPEDQRAVVPNASIDRILIAAEETAMVPWDALSPEQWGLEADKLRTLLEDEMWFIDRVELREPLFLMYAQIGRAAESSNNPAPPYYAQVGSSPVNYYFYLAGVMAHETPELLSKLTDRELNASINNYKTQIDRGVFDPVTLSFDLDNSWDADAFNEDFSLFINGRIEVITDDKGLKEVPPGIIDVYLRRNSSGGESLSARYITEKKDDGFEGVLFDARKRMGIDFVEQLTEHMGECSPEVSGDILAYLSIYQKLHKDAFIYIAIPYKGSVSTNRILLWRWDEPTSSLRKVDDNTGGFPVRFVALTGAGLSFNGASYAPPTAEDIANSASASNPNNPSAGLTAAKQALDVLPDFTPSGIPLHFQLRGHYGRLMVETGLQFSPNLPEGVWRDLYQTDRAKAIRNGSDAYSLEDTVATEVVVSNGATSIDPAGDYGPCDSAPPGEPCLDTVDVPVDVLRVRSWQRLVHLGVGIVLGKDATSGFGPRGFIRTGWYNAPHAVDLSMHLGYALQIGKKEDEDRSPRVRALTDFDVYGGAMLPFQDSLFIRGENRNGEIRKIGDPLANFGFSASVGMTF